MRPSAPDKPNRDPLKQTSAFRATRGEKAPQFTCSKLKSHHFFSLHVEIEYLQLLKFIMIFFKRLNHYSVQCVMQESQ